MQGAIWFLHRPLISTWTNGITVCLLWAQVGSVIYSLTETVKPTRPPPLLFVFFFSPQTVSISISCQTPAALTRQRRGTLPLMLFTPTDWGQPRGRSAGNCWLDAADGQPISRRCCSWEESEAKCEHLKHHRVSNRFKPNRKADLFFFLILSFKYRNLCQFR